MEIRIIPIDADVYNYMCNELVELKSKNNALTSENKLLSERVKEQNDIIDSWKKQYQILCDKHYAEKDRLTQNIQSIRSELNITRDERDVSRKLFTEWHEKAISMREEILDLRKSLFGTEIRP